MTYTLLQLQSVKNQLVRFRYKAQGKGEKRDLVQRKGTKSDQIQGRAGEAWVTKEKAIVLPVRNQNQQVPGDRNMVSDTLVKIAMESEKKFHGMPGEFLPITCRAEGIEDLEVMRGNKWVKVT